MRSKNNTNTKKLIITAVLLSLALALSLVKVWQMPLGGSITLCSMLPVSLISIQYGVKWGIRAGAIYSLMQFLVDMGSVLSWGLTLLILIGSIVFDYIIPYTALGLSGIFRKKGIVGICLGIFIALFISFISHIFSGVIFFGELCPDNWSPLIYSICYNGAYMLPEMIITMIGGSILFKLPQINKIMNGDKLD